MAATTATPSKPSLDSAQRAWLAKMGAALQAPVSKGDTGISQTPKSGSTVQSDSPGTKQGVGAAAPTGQAPPDPNAEKFEKETLKVGAKGPAVEHLQKLLKDNGAAIEVDGKFGPATETAVKNFQKAKSLGVDGIVGQKTWTALKASKPAPPAPPDTKPRRAVFIVTDATTNDAVPGATVKVGDQTEKTGNTGQAILSLAPGSFVFGVTADGFEQAVDKFDVTANDESQIRVEMKAGERSTKTVLTVEPKDKSNKGDKLKLTATVTASNGKPATSGTVRFDVVSKETARLTLATVPVKDGVAIHTETKLPKGSHLLDATFKPDTTPFQISQSAPVRHEVQQDEKSANREVAKRIVDALNGGDKDEIEKEILELKQPRSSMRRLLNIMTLVQKADKSEDLLGVLGVKDFESDRIAVAVFTSQRRFTQQWFKIFKDLDKLDRGAVLARTPSQVIAEFELQNEPANPPDPNDEPDDPKAKIVIDPGVSTKAKIAFNSPTFGFLGTTPEFEVKIGPNGKMKGSLGIDMDVVKKKLKGIKALGQVLELEGKLSLSAGAEFKEHENVLKTEVQASIKGECQLKFPELKVLKNVAFKLEVQFDTGGKFEFGGAISIPIPSL